MKQQLSTLLLLVAAATSYAQQEAFKWRVGAYIGTGFSSSDISLTASPSTKDLVYGLTTEYFFNKAWGARALIGVGQVTANDRAFKGETFARGLNAQTRFQDISLMASYYFDNERNMSEVAKFAPYFTAGIGFTNFAVYGDLRDVSGNLYTQNYAEEWTQDGVYETKISDLRSESDVSYPSLAFNIPVGLGLKYRVNDRININLEAIAKFSFTDYLDNASGAFRSDIPNSFTSEQRLAAKPNPNYTGARAGVNGNDMYGHIGLSVNYNFGLKAVDIIDVPVIYIGQTSKTPEVITDPISENSAQSSPINMNNVKGNTSGVSTMPQMADSRRISNYFKTKDTVSAAIAEVERMRLQVAYINKDLAAMDTTANNAAFIQSQSARLIDIRNKAKEYHKFSIGTPEEQEKVKEANGDLQNERKETLVSINILTLPSSDKSKVIDNLRKKDALNEAFITRQEAKVNEMRVENGLAAITKSSIKPAEKPIAVAEKPIVKPAEKPIAVAEKPIVKPAEKPIAVAEKPTVKPAEKQILSESRPPDAPNERSAAALAKTPEIIAAEKMVAEMKAQMATEKAAMKAELDKKDAELRRTNEELVIVQQKVKEATTTAILQKDKEIRDLKKRLAELENLILNPTETPAVALATPQNTSKTPAIETPEPISAPIAEAPKPKVIDREAAKTKLAEIKKDIEVKEEQKQKMKDNKGPLNNQIWFVPNDGSLTSIQTSRLNQVIAFMDENPTARVDLRPFIEPGMRNPDLPYERADNVKNYLIQKGNIPLERIEVSVAGTGAVQLGKKWISGRRVEIVFLLPNEAE